MVTRQVDKDAGRSGGAGQVLFGGLEFKDLTVPAGICIVTISFYTCFYVLFILFREILFTERQECIHYSS